jgi:Zn ribbon nucleic-acid-binding protein
VSKSFTFPVWLAGTPAEQEAEASRQALLAASFTRAKQTEAERLIGRGALLEQTARQNFEQSFGVKGKEEERKLAKAQIAEALAMQGRYAEASELHPDTQRRADFRAIGRAVEMPDEEKCGCADSKLRVNDVELSVTPRFERQRIFSPVHNDVISLVECSRCGHRNARPLRSRLLKHHAAVNESMRARRPVLSDAQVLNASS